MNKNKVQYNLRKAHYALLTMNEDDNVSFDTPVAIPGAVSLSVSPVGEVKPFYADGIEYFSVTSNGGYEGDFEAAQFPESFLTDVLGEEISTVDKVLVENAYARVKPFAFLFEFEGDVKAVRRVLFNCIAKRPSMEGNTSTETTDVKPQKLSLKARPLSGGMIKAQTGDTTLQNVYDNWYKKVWYGDTGGGA